MKSHQYKSQEIITTMDKYKQGPYLEEFQIILDYAQ